MESGYESGYEYGIKRRDEGGCGDGENYQSGNENEGGGNEVILEFSNDY
nr:9559_t:CDS:2 [Entrophospora candida]